MDDATSRGSDLLRKYSRPGNVFPSERLNDGMQPPNAKTLGRYMPSARFGKTMRSSMQPSVDEMAQRKALERMR